MRTQRVLVALAAFLGIGALVGGTAGYGAYYRSDHYRQSLEARLAAFFGLPTDVGRIQPRSFSARELLEVEMWLPDRRDRIFHSPRAVWNTAGANGGEGTVIHLHNPVLVVGSEQWRKDDYMRVLRASLAHNFRRLNISEVWLHQARLDWPRRDFRLRAEDVAGSIHFGADGLGTAQLVAHRLNGMAVAEPIQIFGRLDPHQAHFLPEVTLVVPRLPLDVLGLDQVLGSPVTQGWFAGRITFRQSPDGDTIELQGSAGDVRLEELTGRLAGGAVPALVDLVIDEAVVRERRLLLEQEDDAAAPEPRSPLAITDIGTPGWQLDRIAFSGEVRQLQVDSLLASLGLPQIGGQVRLTIYGGRVEGDRICRLGVAGEWIDGSLEMLTRTFLGRAGVSGNLRFRVNALVIEENQVAGADIDIIVDPPAGGAGRIDRELLVDLFQQQWGVSLPQQLLPADVEFVQLGAKLVVDRGHVRVLAVQGPAGKAIITARILGRLVPLLGDTDHSFALDPLLERLREQASLLKGLLKERFKSSSPAGPS